MRRAVRAARCREKRSEARLRPVFLLPDAAQVFLSGIIRTGSHAADHRPDRAIRLTPYTTFTYSERSRNRRRPCECRALDGKCVGNAPLSSRSGRIASGITWRLRKGAVLGSSSARAPKVPPKMVGPLLRGNDFGGNPKEGGKQHLNFRRNAPYSEWGRSPGKEGVQC